MPTSFTFNGKTILKPGAYIKTKNGVQNPPIGVSYGKVLMIDLGTNTDGFVGGSGIAGTHLTGKDSIKSYKSIGDFQLYGAKGGIFWELGKALFNPDKGGAIGTDEIFIAKAAATTPGEVAFTLTNGSFTVQTVDEGTFANGLALNKSATSKVTITNAGGVGATIGYSANGTLIGTYTSTGGTVQDAVNALALAIESNGPAGYTVIEKGTNYLIVAAPVSLGATANGYSSTVAVTGTAAASAVTPFAGGANNYYLYKGYGVKMVAGVGSPSGSTYVWEFYMGTWTGLDAYGKPFNGISQSDASKAPLLLFKSPEFQNLADFVEWMGTSSVFATFFKLKTSTTTGPSPIVPADLTSNASLKLASGATQTYNSTHLTTLLESVKDLGYNFVITDHYGTDGTTGAKSSMNTSILYHLANDAIYKKYLFVAVGDTADYWNDALNTALYYNSNQVVVVHGGLEKNTSTGYRKYQAIVKAAQILGRTCGLPPQVPVTFKGIDMDKDMHSLTSTQIDTGLQYGVTMTQYDPELLDFIVVQGLTSLQPYKNETLVASDVLGNAISHDLAVERVIAQVEKLFLVNVKLQLLSQQLGVNKNTLSAAVLTTWTQGFLQTMVASNIQDNLIISFKNVVSTINADTICVQFEFEPNTPINKLCIVGAVIDPTTQNVLPLT